MGILEEGMMEQFISKGLGQSGIASRQILASAAPRLGAERATAAATRSQVEAARKSKFISKQMAHAGQIQRQLQESRKTQRGSSTKRGLLEALLPQPNIPMRFHGTGFGTGRFAMNQRQRTLDIWKKQRRELGLLSEQQLQGMLARKRPGRTTVTQLSRLDPGLRQVSTGRIQQPERSALAIELSKINEQIAMQKAQRKVLQGGF